MLYTDWTPLNADQVEDSMQGRRHGFESGGQIPPLFGQWGQNIAYIAKSA